MDSKLKNGHFGKAKTSQIDQICDTKSKNDFM